MKYAKKIIKELKKNNDVDSANEIREFVTECAKVMSSKNSTKEEVEFFKFAMKFFDEEALKELQKMNNKKKDN